MTTDIKSSNVIFADDSYYKTQKLKIGNRTITTPIKAVDLNKKIQGIDVNKLMKGVNEIYKELDATQIKTILSSSREQEINNEITRKKRDASDDEVNIIFTGYNELKIPTADEIEYMTNLSHVHSHITPIPLLTKFSKNINDTNFSSYNKFIKDSIKSIEVMNNQPIMGTISMNLTSTYLPQVLKTYLDNGIRAFCLDFQGSTISSGLTKIRSMVKNMKQENALDHSFIYVINLGSGKLPKNKDIVPAKDILSFGYGFDAIGGQHIKKFLPPEVRAKILSSTNMFENSVRLFNKDNYGYYRTNKADVIESIYPKDSQIPVKTLESIKTKTEATKMAAKIFNQEQQGLEAVKLRKVIAEQHELLKYLDKKQYVDKTDIKNLQNIKKKK